MNIEDIENAKGLITSIRNQLDSEDCHVPNLAQLLEYAADTLELFVEAYGNT